jgi:sugar transferase (PEP-CTERM system associated)
MPQLQLALRVLQMGKSEPTAAEAARHRRKAASVLSPAFYDRGEHADSRAPVVDAPVAAAELAPLREPWLAARPVQWLWTVREAASTSWIGPAQDRMLPAIGTERVLVVGHGPLADHILGDLQKRPSSYHLVGQVVPVDPSDGLPDDGTGVERLERLEDIVARDAVDRLIVAMSERRGDLPLDQLLACRMKGIVVEDGTAFCERATGRIPLTGLKPGYFVFGNGFRWPSRAAKRALDLALAMLVVLAAAPVFLLMPLLIKFTSPGPVFYRQARVGLQGRRFTILKFRSMFEGAERAGTAVWAEERDPRITPIGRFMRKFRLDELPQVFNVLRGDMSFVGPRPERPEFIAVLSREIPYYSLRLAVKPGITGWAQIKYRYGASIQDAAEKLQYDLYYIKHMSLALDAGIAMRTVRTVLSQFGAR